MWTSCLLFLQALLLALLGGVAPGGAIDCFECYSVDGSVRDCEDEFGPQNKTGHMISRACRVGILNFAAHYCVKIKGVKENGQHILIRTCAMDDWGTQCGDLLIEQESKMEAITGCLATCDYDGCNAAPHWFSRNHMTALVSVCACLARLVSSGRWLGT